MIRSTFRDAHRAARVALRTFSGTRGDTTADERQKAEARWIGLVYAGPVGAAACAAVHNGLTLPGSLATSALYAYRHGLYTAGSNWQRWVRERLQRGA